MRKCFLFFFLLGFGYQYADAQVRPDSVQVLPAADTTIRADSSAPGLPVSPADSLKRDSLLKLGPVYQAKADSGQKAGTAAVVQEEKKEGIKNGFRGKENFFFVLLGLLMVLGLLKQFFPKYFNDLLRVFLRRTLKQRQIYEQMIQTPLPSLLLNVFFVVTGSMYISYLLNYFSLPINDNFWIQTMIVTAGLSAIYLVKYIGLKFTGWLFNIKATADDYSFIVFMINKVMGILLLPLIIMMLLGNKEVAGFSLFFSWAALGVLVLYRLFLSFRLVHNSVKVSSFHFILYFLGFEIIPLLLIYRLLLLFF